MGTSTTPVAWPAWRAGPGQVAAHGRAPRYLGPPAAGPARVRADELPTLIRSRWTPRVSPSSSGKQPSLLVDGCVLITGEVDRVTDFEHGMPPAHQAWTGETWQHDPLVIDDQALVVHVRDRGLVVLTGCGHAGAVNIVRHARRLTGVRPPARADRRPAPQRPRIRTVIRRRWPRSTELAPDLVVPGHCTGWRAQHALAAALPDAWVASSSGSSYHLTAA